MVDNLAYVSSDKDVYSFIAETLSDIVPECTTILVYSFDPDTSTLFLQVGKVSGQELSDKGRVLKSPLLNLSIPVPGESLPDLLTGECIELKGELTEPTFSLLSSKPGHHVEAKPFSERVYYFGISWEEELLGAVLCILEPGKELESHDDVSLFLLQVAGLLYLKQRKEPVQLSDNPGIGEQRNEQESCISENSSLYHILNTIADPVIVKNENHQRILVNDAYCRLLGRNPEELINRTDHEIYSSEQAEICSREDNLVFASGKERVTEEQITDYSGQVHTMVTKKNLLVDGQGNRFIVGISRDVTEQKKVEDALRKSEELLSLAMSAADLGIWTWNIITDERHVYLSQETLYGYTGQELEDLFRNIEELAHPDNRDGSGALNHPIRNSQTRDAVEFELRLKDKDGFWRLLLIRGSAIQWNEDQKPVLLMGTFRDITDKRLYEDQIIRLSALKEKLLGLSDLQSQLKLVSEEVVSIFHADFARIWLIKDADNCDTGCRHASVMKGYGMCKNRKRCLHLMASSGRYTHIDGDHRRIPLGCYKIGKLAIDAEPFFITNDVTHDPRVHDHAWAGSLGLVSFAGFRLLSSDLEPTGVLGLFRKTVIPEQEAELLADLANTLSQVIISGIASEAQRENEAKYKALYEGANDAIFILDNLVFFDCNQKTEDLLGFSREQIIGHNQTDFSPEFQPDGVPSLDRASENILSVLAGEPRFFEWVFFHVDDTVLYTEMSLSRITLHGKWYVLAIVRDITGRKQAEDALKKAHEELEQKVQERTKALRESEKRLRLKLDSVLSPDSDISNLELVNILDIPTIQSLMEDFTRLTGMTTAIMDLHGNVIESTGWQDICSQFHRVHEKTRQDCTESILLSGRNANPGHIVMNKCKNNVWSVVTPLYIGNNHAGNIYTGQFFYDDETVDETIFISYAEQYGFNRDEYLSALHGVPRFSRNQIDNLMDYLVKFTAFISRLSYSNLLLARTMVEEKKVKEELIRSEHRLSDIINHLPDATFAIDLQGKVIVWNKAIEEMTGVRSKDILWKNHYEYALPFYGYRTPTLIDCVLKNDEELEKRYTFVQQEGDVFIAEVDLVLPDGRNVVLWVKATPLHDELGNTIGAIESIRDVTERRKAEDALRESEDKFRNLAEKSLVGIYLIQDGVFQYVNGMIAEIFGYSIDEIIKKMRPQDFILPQDLPMYEEYLHKKATGVNEPMHYEFRGLTKQKKIVDIDTFGSKIHYKGKPAIIGTLFDITERKKAEAVIHESEEKFHAVFDAAQDGMLVVDPQTRRFVMANDTMGNLTGYSEDELLCLSVADIHPPADISFVLDQFGKLIRGEIVLATDIPVLRKDGSFFYADVKSSVVHMQGKTCYLGIFRDATDRIRAEEELSKFYNELEQRVIERTAQLSQTQAAFQQANKKLSLLSGITRHDINNQLQALRGYLELSRESLHDPASLSELIAKEEKIAGTITHQIHFTKDYEDLGLQSPMWQNVVIIIKSAAGRLQMRDIHLDAGDLHLEMYADPLLGKVFFNLIDNALRYGGDKMTLIRVTNYEDKENLIIVVEDDGKGISTDDKKRLFTKGFGKNTGLGLFLSREILSITGITITETGKQGEGARFEITVPGGMWRLSQWDTKKE